jgi:hypothetical protein
MILDILKDSIEYSAQSWKTVFKLGFLIFMSFLFFPIFFVGGYSYRITNIALNGMINGEDALPEFKNWKKMFIKGIKVFTVKFIYLLPVTIIIILGLIFKINFMVLIITSLFTGIILYFFSIMGVVHMVKNKGNLRAAFKVKELFLIIQSIGWNQYIGFYVGFLAVITGLLSVALFLSGMIFWICYLIIQAFILDKLFYGNLVLATGSVIFGIIFVFLFMPYFIIFESRAVGLIYNMQE